MTPKYKQGWNERILKSSENYGAVYYNVGGQMSFGRVEAKTWSDQEKKDYIRGWEEASAKIASLVMV